MRNVAILALLLLVFWGCVTKPLFHPQLRHTPLVSDPDAMEHFSKAEYAQALKHFQNNCQMQYAQNLYGALCDQALHVTNAKQFFQNNFELYRILPDKEPALLTGYYEPLLHGSRTQSERYRYALYEPPKDMLHVELGDAYEDLKNRRLRGKVVDGKIVAYDDRQGIESQELNTTVICYVDNKLERFFLEVQGSGRVVLDDGSTIYVGYADQNGHAYSSIGKALIARGAIAQEDISLQRIATWFKTHPESVDDILNLNRAFVFFKERTQSATGAMGLVLTPEHSVAVDPRYIPYGAMLDLQSPHYRRIVFAEDSGGAIKGRVRADLFLGEGTAAFESAGKLNETLTLRIWLAKSPQGTITP